MIQQSDSFEEWGLNHQQGGLDCNQHLAQNHQTFDLYNLKTHLNHENLRFFSVTHILQGLYKHQNHGFQQHIVFHILMDFTTARDWGSDKETCPSKIRNRQKQRFNKQKVRPPVDSQVDKHNLVEIEIDVRCMSQIVNVFECRKKSIHPSRKLEFPLLNVTCIHTQPNIYSIISITSITSKIKGP